MAKKSDYPAMPKEIPLNGNHTVGSTFGTAEVEGVAGRLVLFLKAKNKNRWAVFTLEELRAFYLERGWDPNTMLYGLVGPYLHYGNTIRQYEDRSFLLVDPDGIYSVTREFVTQCLPRERRTAQQPSRASRQ